MRAATGRDPHDVQIAARCLLAVLARDGEPTPEERAAAGLLAFGLLDLHQLTRLLGK